MAAGIYHFCSGFSWVVTATQSGILFPQSKSLHDEKSENWATFGKYIRTDMAIPGISLRFEEWGNMWGTNPCLVLHLEE